MNLSSSPFCRARIGCFRVAASAWRLRTSGGERQLAHVSPTSARIESVAQRRRNFASTSRPYILKNDTQWRRLFTISATAALCWFLYLTRQKRGTIKMDNGPSEPLEDEVGPDPTIAPRAREMVRSHADVKKATQEYIPDLPREKAVFATAPDVPPPLKRDYPVILEVPLETTVKMGQISGPYKYEQWTFNDTVPGPFFRARVGDVVELSLTNKDDSGNPHNIDCHSVVGPGGGSALTTASEGETKTARFKLLWPGLFLYHCAAAPVPVHIANGMYGLVHVMPEEGDLPPVDREYYVMQSEFYHEPPEKMDNGRPSPVVEFSYPNALNEQPDLVVFNGHEGAVTRDKPLKARIDETVRIFFGNAGPNCTSSFHVIGSNFNKVYRDGDVLSPPGQFVQTISVPPGSASIVEMKIPVPGTYTLVDHAIFRLDKGAVGYLNVAGEPRPEIYNSAEPPAPCVGCKLHP